MEQGPQQDARYLAAANRHGAAIERLAMVSEADADLRQDLIQNIHAALWRSFARFEDACSERTWVYRVAHNVAASHIGSNRRARAGLVWLDDLHSIPDGHDTEVEAGDRLAAERLHALIARLKTPDREITILYLEGLSAAETADVTGMSAGAVAVRIHRVKSLLARAFLHGVDQ